jgi:hypothetical protein
VLVVRLLGLLRDVFDGGEHASELRARHEYGLRSDGIRYHGVGQRGRAPRSRAEIGSARRIESEAAHCNKYFTVQSVQVVGLCACVFGTALSSVVVVLGP